MKLGTSIVALNETRFDNAFVDIKNNFMDILSEDEKKVIQDFSSVMEEKRTQYVNALQNLGKLKIYHGRRQFNRAGTPVIKSNNCFRLNSDDLFQFTFDASAIDNVDVYLVNNEEDVNKSISFNGLGKLLTGLLGKEALDRDFIVTTPTGKAEFEKLFNVRNTYNLDNIITEEKAYRKAERKRKALEAKVDGSNEKVFTNLNGRYRDSAISYTELCNLMATSQKKCVILIRSKADINHGRSLVLVSKLPTSNEEAKTFKASDLVYRGVYDDVREVAKRYPVEGYEFYTITPTNYKKLKLWNDTNFLTEEQAIEEIIKPLGQKHKKHTIINYCADALLSGRDMDSIKETFELIGNTAPEGGKQTRFWKMYSLAVKTLEKQNEILESEEYKPIVSHPYVYRDFDMDYPLVAKDVDETIFKGYPLLSYFGRSWSNASISVCNNEVAASLWHYVMLEESKLVK